VVELSSRLVMCPAHIEPNVFPHPEDSLVSPNSQGGFLGSHNFQCRVFNKLVVKVLGMGRRFSPHWLRYTWASLHMARGTPHKWIQDQGGWTTAKLPLDTYGHFMPTESHGFADAPSTAANGPETARRGQGIIGASVTGNDYSLELDSCTDADSSGMPRSPIMHSITRRLSFRLVVLCMIGDLGIVSDDG
jgi:hypothetical protein